MSVSTVVSVVDSAESLSHLATRRDRARCHVALPELTDGENKVFEEQINKLRAACGCPEGAAAMLLSLLCYAVLLGPGGYHRSQLVLTELALGMTLMVAALVAGKAIGLRLARRRLRRKVRLLATICGSRQHRDGAVHFSEKTL